MPWVFTTGCYHLIMVTSSKPPGFSGNIITRILYLILFPLSLWAEGHFSVKGMRRKRTNNTLWAYHMLSWLTDICPAHIVFLMPFSRHSIIARIVNFVRIRNKKKKKNDTWQSYCEAFVSYKVRIATQAREKGLQSLLLNPKGAFLPLWK